MQLRNIVLSISCLAVAGLTAPPAFGALEIEYTVTVDTTSVQLSNGYIDLQFNPSSFPTEDATATVSSFITNGVLNPADPGNGTVGGVSGGLQGSVGLTNGQTTNEYTEAMIFGSSITFDLLLSGPAISAPNGEGGGTFTLDFLNAGLTGYLFTADPLNDVPVLTVDINGDGSTTATTYPTTANGGAPVVTFSGPTPVTPVPEPASLLLLGSIALGIAVWQRERVRKSTRAHARPATSTSVLLPSIK